MQKGVSTRRTCGHSFYGQDRLRGLCPPHCRFLIYTALQSLVLEVVNAYLNCLFWTTEGKNLFILYAPHIGISESGELGMYNRKGTGTYCETYPLICYVFFKHSVLSIALKGLFKPKRDVKLRRAGDPPLRTGPADPTCGAACGALKHCAEGKFIPVPGQVFGDYQMDYIKTQVNARKQILLQRQYLSYFLGSHYSGSASSWEVPIY